MFAARASGPETRKDRTAPTVQPSTILINSNSASDSVTTLRLQRLFGFGVIGIRAGLIAHLAWGVEND